MEERCIDGEFLDSSLSEGFFTAVYGLPAFAHHPTCDCYDGHLLRFGKISLCLGCVCLTSGAVFFVSLFLVAQLVYQPLLPMKSLVVSWLFGLVLFSPTLAHPLLQRKAFKVLSRFLLGGSIVCLFYGAIFLIPFTLMGILIRIVFCLFFRFAYRETQRFRDQYTADPKEKCSRGCFPFCEGNRERLQSILEDIKANPKAGPEFINFAESFVESKTGEVEVFDNPSHRPNQTPDDTRCGTN